MKNFTLTLISVCSIILLAITLLQGQIIRNLENENADIRHTLEIKRTALKTIIMHRENTLTNE